MHVCTRDGCLSGDKDDAKFTWDEAKSMCELSGRRLCQREELNRYGSAGCCSRTDMDRCGYDMELVWTSTVGGLQTNQTQGNLGSKNAFTFITTLTVDLEKVHNIQGVQLQGGVADTFAYGPACFSANWSYAFAFTMGAIWLTIFAMQSPMYALNYGFLPAWRFALVIYIARTIILFFDPAVPDFLSMNPNCPTTTQTRTFFTVTFENIASMILLTYTLLVHWIRPDRVIIRFVTGLFAMMSLRDFLTLQYGGASLDVNPGQNIAVWIFAMFALPFGFRFLRRYTRRMVRVTMEPDVVKYEKEWHEAGGSSEISKGPAPHHNELEFMKAKIVKANVSLAEKRKQASSSKQYSLWSRFLFLSNIDGLGPYARTKKMRQSSSDLDVLFEEAAVVNDHFFAFLLDKVMTPFLFLFLSFFSSLSFCCKPSNPLSPSPSLRICVASVLPSYCASRLLFAND